jgi:hypothetical protein
MKQLLVPVVAGLALAGCTTGYGWSEAPLPDSAYAPVSWWGRDVASVDIFYGALAGQGTWGVHPRYGRVFFPGDVGAGWQPYSRGYWREDPRYGRTWVSQEPWGWATYHYGRWGRDSRLGWFWVPDTRFGPSWVDWRSGGGYASWSPLPPYGWDRWGYAWGNDWWVSAPGAWIYRPGMGGYWRPGRHDRWDDRDGHHGRDDRDDRDRDRDRPGTGRPPAHVDSDPPVRPIPSPYGRHPRSDPEKANPAYVRGERQPRSVEEGGAAWVGGERQPPRNAWQGGQRPGFQRGGDGDVHPRSAPQQAAAGFGRSAPAAAGAPPQAVAEREVPAPRAEPPARAERSAPSRSGDTGRGGRDASRGRQLSDD